MAFANFEQLCASVCEVAGIAPPVLEADARGITAFTFEYDAGQISVMERRDVPGLVIVACSLGPAPPEAEHRACRMLMANNFMMMGRPAAPCVGLNPLTNEFVLHLSQRLQDATGPDIYQAIVAMADLAHEWRDALAAVPTSAEPEQEFGIDLA